MKKFNITGINTAVILAAGMGMRLRNVTGFCPKGMLEIGGKSLISRSLEILKNHGINRVVIVTGFQSNMYLDHLQPQTKFPNIEFVHSSRYFESGSMHSLFVAKDVLKEDFLLLESDLIYETRALSSVINYDGYDVVLASGETKSNDEVYIFGENNDDDSEKGELPNISTGKIIAINKQLRHHLKIKGELVGISKISQKLFKMMCKRHKQNLSFPCYNHYEECISEICSKKMVPYLRVSDLVWTEIDNQNHYDIAIKKIYPMIIQKEEKNCP